MDEKPEAGAGPDPDTQAADANDKAVTGENKKKTPAAEAAAEFGGPKGAEPTRFGDWERKGRCIDF